MQKFIRDNEYVELKTTKKKLVKRFEEAVTQSNNVLIRIKDDISVYIARKRIQDNVDNISKEKGFNVKDKIVFLYFEKKLSL